MNTKKSEETQSKGKTIKQIADELGVSKQAVHQKRKSAELSTALQPFTSTVNNVVYISADGENLIKSAFRDDTGDNSSVNVDVNERKQLDGSFTLVYSMVDALKDQLSSKDKLIDEQQQTIRELTAALLTAQQTAQTAQLLHGGTIQAQITDGSKRGFFSRLFSGKNRNADQ